MSEANSDGEEYTSGESGESEDGSGSGSENGSYESSEGGSGSGSEETETESEEEEETEPVLKYKRFARDVVASISQSQGGEGSNVICCMAVHSKVCGPWSALIRK